MTSNSNTSEKKDIVIDLFATSVNLKLQIALPEIPLNMSVCEGSDNEDFEVKPELMDSDKVKLEDFIPELESGNTHSYPVYVLSLLPCSSKNNRYITCTVQSQCQATSNTIILYNMYDAVCAISVGLTWCNM